MEDCEDREYIQPECETSDWVIYAEYVMWAMSQDGEGDVLPKQTRSVFPR